MKKTLLLPLILFGFIVSSQVLFLPTTASAFQCNDKADNDDDKTADFEGTAALPKDPDCSSATDDNESTEAVAPVTKDLSFDIINPLDSDIDTLPEFINKVVEIFLMVGTPIVALMIIYAGFLFVVARGNPEAIEKAKKTLGFTLLGAAILLGAFVISTAIQDTITSISKEGTTDTP